MKTDLFESLQSAVKNWWLSAIVGVLFIVVAILMFAFPITGYQTLAIVFAVLMFAVGLFEIIFAVTNRDVLSGWGWYLALGILDLLIGLFLIFNPAMSAAILPYLMAFWLMFRGFSMIGFSIDLQQFGNKSWGWYLAIGILTIICSIAILFFPLAGALSVVYLVSFTFIFLGVARIMLAFDMKKLYDDSKKVQKKIDDRR